MQGAREGARHMLGNRKRTLLGLIMFLLPLALCVGGFYASGRGILDSLYLGVQAYMLQLGVDDNPNAAVEVGRWLAPIATSVLGISALAAVVQGRLWSWICVRVFKRPAVYGDADLIERYCGPGAEGDGLLPRYVAPGNDHIVKADEYVLMFHDDAEALGLYSGELERLVRGNAGARVYIGLTGLNAQSVGADVVVHTFRIEDYVARRLFTSEAWVRRCSGLVKGREGHDLRVALIGSGGCIEATLEAALELNLYDVRQHVTYYAFGLGEKYQMLHEDVIGGDRLRGDRVEPVGGDWRSAWSREVVSACDAVILCGSHADNVANAADLIRACPFAAPGDGGPVPIIVLGVGVDTADLLRREVDNVAGALERKGKSPTRVVDLAAFGVPGSAGFTLDEIIADAEEGYALADEHHGGGRARGTLGKDGPFKYWSTVLREYYAGVVWAMVRDRLCGPTGEGAPVFDRKACDDFARLEHERWCRYHYLSNWRPCETADERNDALHTHNCLRSWEDLESDKVRAYDYKPLFFALLDNGLDPDAYIDKGVCDYVDREILHYRSRG